MALPWIIGAAAVAVVTTVAAAISSDDSSSSSSDEERRRLREKEEEERRRAEERERERERERLAAAKKAKEAATLQKIKILLDDHGIDSSRSAELHRLIKEKGVTISRAEFLKEWDKVQDNKEIQDIEKLQKTLNQLKQALRG